MTHASSKATTEPCNRSKEVAPPQFPTEPLTGNLSADHVLTIAACAGPQSDFFNIQSSWGSFVEHISTHEVRDQKSGLAVMLAEVREHRTDSNVVAVSALGYEIDGKLTLDDVKLRVGMSGYEAVVWTTHNHSRTTQHIGLATFEKWYLKKFDADCMLANDLVRLFCSESKRYSHLTNVRLANEGKARTVWERGQKVVVFDIEHDPEHKTRIVFPLAKPFPLKDGTHSIEDFKAVYCAFGHGLFGDAYSPESKNPARLHYLPSHPPGRNGESHHFEGSFVDAEALLESVKPELEAKRKASSLRANLASAGLDELEHVLRSIPPDLEYPDWYRCLAAIYHETNGSDEGNELAHEWSSGDARYDFDEVERIWDGFDLSHPKPATMGTLIKFAKTFDKSFRQLPPRARAIGYLNLMKETF